MNVGVHTSHCCKKHGCKYGNEDCPVELGTHKQEYPCESCGWEEETYYPAFLAGFAAAQQRKTVKRAFEEWISNE